MSPTVQLCFHRSVQISGKIFAILPFDATFDRIMMMNQQITNFFQKPALSCCLKLVEVAPLVQCVEIIEMISWSLLSSWESQRPPTPLAPIILFSISLILKLIFSHCALPLHNEWRIHVLWNCLSPKLSWPPSDFWSRCSKKIVRKQILSYNGPIERESW